jgi:hypothetical protein
MGGAYPYRTCVSRFRAWGHSNRHTDYFCETPFHLPTRITLTRSSLPYSFPFTYTVAVSTFIANRLRTYRNVLLQILPVSIARYRSFAHHPVPHSATFFADVIYLSNGLFNVLLFSITRPSLLPHDPPTTTVESQHVDPPQIGLNQIRLHTDAVQPRQPGGSPTNPHTPQLDGRNNEIVQPSPGVSYDPDVESLGPCLFFSNNIKRPYAHFG